MLVGRDVANSLEKVDLLLLDAIDHYAEHLRLGRLNIAALDQFLSASVCARSRWWRSRIANAAGETFIGSTAGPAPMYWSMTVSISSVCAMSRRSDGHFKARSGKISGKWAIVMARRLPDVDGRLPESPTPASVLIISSSSLSACKPARQVPLPCAMAIWPCWPASRGRRCLSPWFEALVRRFEAALAANPPGRQLSVPG